MLRQPIVCVLGHVDHGKTTLLDAIRETAVASKESGGITQHVSASEVPLAAIKDLCGTVLEKMKLDLQLPGLLFIDTPGHEAFVNLRKRGGSIADIAILVVDINQGMQNQTREAIEILREYKTPFVVAATKIDVLMGWKPQHSTCFADAFMGQRKEVQDFLDTKLYQLVGQLSEFGFSAERFDRVEDFTKQIAIIPVSAKTAEGIAELLLFVGGLAQRFLETQLTKKEEALGKGSILEVKDVRGLGMTLDVILYEGTLSEGEHIVFLTKDGKAVKTRIKGLLKPNNSEEVKASGERYKKVKEITAAAGVKIACDHAEDAVAGSSLYEFDERTESETADSLRKEFEEIKIESSQNGVIIEADALGSLEAIVRLFEAEKIPIRHAGIGKVTKRDILEAASVTKIDQLLGVCFAFHTQVETDVQAVSKVEGVKIFEEKVIYNLIVNYKSWRDEKLSSERKEAFSKLTLPAKIYLIPNNCFRVSNPCIFGVEVREGRIRKENRLINGKGESIGEIRSIQVEKEAVDEAKKGQEVAIAVDGPYFGRQVNYKDVLFTDISQEEIDLIEKKYLQSLSEGERELLTEIKKIKGFLSYSF
ncbi:MAG TPA: translation initiation factor IF-2 [Candidatus Norongarragalinales archaeon]|nr:translation initiation factor IF-2 [Candidatus Norongarragalinales archaeon]